MKIHNNGFYEYYYKCQNCGSKDVSLINSGGFQHADIVCDSCGERAINQKNRIPESEVFTNEDIIKANNVLKIQNASLYGHFGCMLIPSDENVKEAEMLLDTLENSIRTELEERAYSF